MHQILKDLLDCADKIGIVEGINSYGGYFTVVGTTRIDGQPFELTLKMEDMA